MKRYKEVFKNTTYGGGRIGKRQRFVMLKLWLDDRIVEKKLNPKDIKYKIKEINFNVTSMIVYHKYGKYLKEIK